MAKCPGCDRELTGMEKLCRECFEQRYAQVAASKTGVHHGFLLMPFLALLIAALFVLFRFVPHATKQGIQVFGTAFLGIKIVLACFGVGLGIYESLKWRSAQNLLFWVLTALNLALIIVWFTTGQNRWLLAGVVAFLMAKTWSNHQQNQAA
jgi:hypothetical protein